MGDAPAMTEQQRLQQRMTNRCECVNAPVPTSNQDPRYRADDGHRIHCDRQTVRERRQATVQRGDADLDALTVLVVVLESPLAELIVEERPT